MIPTLAQASTLFTAPVIAGVAGVCVSIPIIIHLLWRVRRKREVWAAMRFLQQAIQKQKNKLRLEHWLLLLTRCLILLLLGIGLAGPVSSGLSKLFGSVSGNRLVHLIIDDTLTTQTRHNPKANENRLDGLKQAANKLLDQMGEKDHLAIWRSAKPKMVLQGPALFNPTQARQFIDRIKPRHTASDLPAVLNEIQSKIDDVAYSSFDQSVVIFSDFSRGSLGNQTGKMFDRLARKATVMLSPAISQVPNIQIEKLTPRRSQLLRPLDDRLSVMLDVTLKRQGKIDQQTTTTIRLFHDGKDVANREHQWAKGQSQATVQMDMTLRGQSSSYPLTLPIHAKISSPADRDRLEADNQRWTQVYIREQLRILLVEQSKSFDATAKDFSASDWLAFALAPTENNLHVQRITPSQLTNEMLANVDVCMLLRPDRISQQQWVAADQWTKSGGLLWIFPPVQTGLPVWTYNLAQQMQLPVRLNVKSVSGDWTLAIADRAPDALSLLGADWQALQRPVRVTQSLALFNIQNMDSTAEIWLRLNDESRLPLIVSQPLGNGHVILSAIALSADWSNLQTRPIFVPLLHESIQSLGSQSAQKKLLFALAGSTPKLPKRFIDSSQLVGPKRLTLKPNDAGQLTPTVPMDLPGVYRANQKPLQNLVLLNIDPTAALLQQVDEQAVRRMLFEHSDKNLLHWLDRENPTWPKVDATVSSQLGRNLLWVVLALLLLETILARYFSHAKTDQRSWGQWFTHGLAKLLHRNPPHYKGDNR